MEIIYLKADRAEQSPDRVCVGAVGPRGGPTYKKKNPAPPKKTTRGGGLRGRRAARRRKKCINHTPGPR